MSFISPVLASKHRINQSIRQREITKSADQISSGNRFASDTGQDSAALRISTKFASQIKTAKTATRNIQNAYQLTQYQADVLRFAEQTIKRMNELAYEATDIMTSDVDRRALSKEFEAHSDSLNQIMYDRTFGPIMFDPLQSPSIDAIEVEGQGGGYETFTDEKKNFGSLGGKIRLWWDPYQARDRLQIFQGNRWFFDTGEYQSRVDSNGNGTIETGEFRPLDGTQDSGGNNVGGDFFEIDFQPGKTSVTPATDNAGNAFKQDNYADIINNDDYFSTPSVITRIPDGIGDISGTPSEFDTTGYKNGPKFRATVGNTTVLKIVVNGDQVITYKDTDNDGNNDITVPNRGTTLWNLFMRIDKNYIDGPTGIKNELGETMELPTVGFSTLEAYDLTTRTNAIEAMHQTQNELDGLEKQIGSLAETYSNLRFNMQRAETRGLSYQTTHGVITDSDMASQATKLAKNLIAQEATESAMVHSRISAENVFNLIL